MLNRRSLLKALGVGVFISALAQVPLALLVQKHRSRSAAIIVSDPDCHVTGNTITGCDPHTVICCDDAFRMVINGNVVK